MLIPRVRFAKRRHRRRRLRYNVYLHKTILLWTNKHRHRPKIEMNPRILQWSAWTKMNPKRPTVVSCVTQETTISHVGICTPYRFVVDTTNHVQTQTIHKVHRSICCFRIIFRRTQPSTHFKGIMVQTDESSSITFEPRIFVSITIWRLH